MVLWGLRSAAEREQIDVFFFSNDACPLMHILLGISKDATRFVAFDSVISDGVQRPIQNRRPHYGAEY